MRDSYQSVRQIAKSKEFKTCPGLLRGIALFTVNFSHLHYNVFERGCEAISGNFGVSARNCLSSTFKYIVMQMRIVNCEKGYYDSSNRSRVLEFTHPREGRTKKVGEEKSCLPVPTFPRPTICLCPLGLRGWSSHKARGSLNQMFRKH